MNLLATHSQVQLPDVLGIIEMLCCSCTCTYAPNRSSQR